MNRRWLILATIGIALVALTLLVVALVLFDKKHFGWMAGSAFLGITAGGMFLGAILLLIATWMLPIRKNWRGVTLFIFALIALTSPAFGLMFLIPWGVLLLLLPLVIGILVPLYRVAESPSRQVFE